MTRFLCVHGHFYQPPRENPWLESVEIQDSAAPYHDWNERILAECYAPNAVSRILDDRGRIEHIVNNYSNLSFDFGPTLLSWLEENAEAVYQAVLMADWESQQRFSGHGSAMAQAYNHLILPLASRRDKQTQIRWGIRDFLSRFNREPEGMWLPETAVDLETLDLLADHGLRFVLLAPHQALRVRRKDGGGWEQPAADALDIGRAYEVVLPSGKSIAAFFYHPGLAHAVSFEGLLSNGDTFARRILEAYRGPDSEDRLLHFAADGETYGHHHRFGDMALAYAVHELESEGSVRLTNYGEYLEKHPPVWQAEIAENTSWSCAHGVERWRADCGCNTGAHPSWSQAWRAPLREAIDGLREALAPRYERAAAEFLKDPWQARDEYIDVILDRSAENLERFFRDHAARELSEEERIRSLKLLELQRHALLMYTSCGWFFDDLAGIEAEQNLAYAGRAVQLGQELFGDGVEAEFLAALEKAHANPPDSRSGKQLYEQTVRPAVVDLPRVGAHYAASSLFESYGERTRIYCYQAERAEHTTMVAGRARLAVGRVRVTSRITRESGQLCYSMLHFGDQNISGGVHLTEETDDFATLAASLSKDFQRGDFSEILRTCDSHFGGGGYSLKDLFEDERRKILGVILDENLAETEAKFSEVYEDHASLMRFLANLKIPVPAAFQASATITLNGQLRKALAADPLDTSRIRGLLDEAASAKVTLEGESLGFQLKRSLEQLAGRWYTEPQDTAGLQNLLDAVELARSLPFWVDLWKSQNVYYSVLTDVYPKYCREAAEGSEDRKDWIRRFLRLGELLQVRTEACSAADAARA